MKIKEKIKKGIIGLLLLSLPLSFQSCTVDDILGYLLEIISQTGWLAEDEDMDNIPEDITPFDNDDSQPFRSVVSLEEKFPPIGDQGSYGTCVTWAVGYNLKTSLNAIEKGWNQSDLGNKNNQTSPKDLWFAIPGASKGTQCNGTNFEPALDALIVTGAADISSSPYSNLGNCTGSATGNSQNKLANYRKIASETEGLIVENFKGYLNAGRPIAIGARLGDRFMNWNSTAVISSDTYNNPGMQHAYHAMALVGYDDSKNAFRVRNSWGASWGDNGSIWVDYDFFCESFCFAAFVAQNTNNISTENDGSIGSGNLSEGYDLLAYSAEDYEEDAVTLERVFTYDIYNSGDRTITPSQKWSVVYMYYNAVDANDDYEIIFEDYYTDEFGAGDGFYEGSAGLVGGWWNNYSVEPGKKAGEAEYGENGFQITYTMPRITGKYYLVVMADAYNVIAEANEDNNFYFITAENGKPLEFSNGRILNMPAPKAKNSVKRPAAYSNTENQTPVKPGNLNAYTPKELKTMLLHDKKTGRLQSKMKSFRDKSGNAQIKQPRKPQ